MNYDWAVVNIISLIVYNNNMSAICLRVTQHLELKIILLYYIIKIIRDGMAYEEN